MYHENFSQLLKKNIETNPNVVIELEFCTGFGIKKQIQDFAVNNNYNFMSIVCSEYDEVANMEQKLASLIHNNKQKTLLFIQESDRAPTQLIEILKKLVLTRSVANKKFSNLIIINALLPKSAYTISTSCSLDGALNDKSVVMPLKYNESHLFD